MKFFTYQLKKKIVLLEDGKAWNESSDIFTLELLHFPLVREILKSSFPKFFPKNTNSINFPEVIESNKRAKGNEISTSIQIIAFVFLVLFSCIICIYLFVSYRGMSKWDIWVKYILIRVISEEISTRFFKLVIQHIGVWRGSKTLSIR